MNKRKKTKKKKKSACAQIESDFNRFKKHESRKKSLFQKKLADNLSAVWLSGAERDVFDFGFAEFLLEVR